MKLRFPPGPSPLPPQMPPGRIVPVGRFSQSPGNLDGHHQPACFEVLPEISNVVPFLVSHRGFQTTTPKGTT